MGVTNPFLVERVGLGMPASELNYAIIGALTDVAGLAPHTTLHAGDPSSISAQVVSRALVLEAGAGHPGRSGLFDDNPRATVEAIRAVINKK